MDTGRCPFEQFSNPLLTHHVLQPLNHLDGVQLDSLQYISVIHWKAQNWAQYTKYALISTEVKNHFSQTTDYILANATQYVVGLLCHKSTAESCSACSLLGNAGLFLLACFVSSQSPVCMYWCMALFPSRCRTCYLPLLNFERVLSAHSFLQPTKIPLHSSPVHQCTDTPDPHHFFIMCKPSKRLNRDWYQYNVSVLVSAGIVNFLLSS